MTHVPYLIAGYGITAGALAAYAGWLVARSRAARSGQAAFRGERGVRRDKPAGGKG